MSPRKHTERQCSRIQLLALEDSHPHPRQAQCRTQTARKRRRGTPSEGPGAYRDRSWGFTDQIVHDRRSCGQFYYLLPAPKTLSSGLNTSGLIFLSLRNLSGELTPTLSQWKQRGERRHQVKVGLDQLCKGYLVRDFRRFLRKVVRALRDFRRLRRVEESAERVV